MSDDNIEPDFAGLLDEPEAPHVEIVAVALRFRDRVEMSLGVLPWSEEESMTRAAYRKDAVLLVKMFTLLGWQRPE